MDKNRPAGIIPKKEVPTRPISKDTPWVPPWLFKHQDLIYLSGNAKAIDQKFLINRLNHINFMDIHVLVHLYDPKNEESILLRAHPEPCVGGKLICRWSDKNLSGLRLETYNFLHILIDDGKSMILVPAGLLEINGDQLSLELPVTSYAVGQRQARRYACRKVAVELIQSGFLARGELLDFSPKGLRIRVRSKPSHSFHRFNSDEMVMIHLRHGEQIVFSGACRCIRQQSDFPDREIVLSPSDENINRYKKKPVRNPRQRLVPSPTLIFDHPLLRKQVQLEVSDISTSGFSVYEEADEGILMQGMIIPELIIDFAGNSRIKCSAQVIYRSEENENCTRYGLVILDMDISNYTRLNHILTSAIDPHFYISRDVDMDALWEFFFESGFIYPKKYRLIQSYREDFKETYRKLYQENPEIARHFTYQKNGRIYGHIFMVKAYERAWVIQHHSSRAMGNKRTGFMILKQIMHYLNDMYRFPSLKTDYYMTYFRPENRIPDRIFGGFTKALNNARGCSLDLFSYLPYTSLSLGARLPDGWLLRESSAPDLWELNRFYNHCSGGLLLDALNLAKRDSGVEPLEETYSRLGFLRKRRTYSLTHKGELKAVLIVSQSDPGLNFSELLNSIKILVINTESLPWNVLSTATAQLTSIYTIDRVPILLYPFDYVKFENVPYEKQYQLWILNVHYADEYMEYMRRKFRISYE
ncbi:MAG: PilZ domain-containing protein [Deltaproteobacteria bacterium]|nr:PilZ domain-containing protein [Deltaproteobacteria bacterium]